MTLIFQVPDEIVDPGVVPTQILHEPFVVLENLTLDFIEIQPRQITLRVLGPLLVLVGFPGDEFLRLGRGRGEDLDAIDEGECLHDRIGQVVLLFTRLKGLEPVRVRGSVLDEFLAPLDGDLLALVVLRFPWTDDVRDLMASVVENRFSLGTLDDEIAMQKVHDRDHLLVPIRLFFDQYGVGGQDPRSSVEVVAHGHVDSVFRFGGNAVHVPVLYQVAVFIVEETERQVPYTNVDTEDH
jgi:hypothetical protein